MFINSWVIFKQRDNFKRESISDIFHKNHEIMLENTLKIVVCKKSWTFSAVKKRLNVIIIWERINLDTNTFLRFFFGYEQDIEDNSEINRGKWRLRIFLQEISFYICYIQQAIKSHNT